jgi:hypothetical protein
MKIVKATIKYEAWLRKELDVFEDVEGSFIGQNFALVHYFDSHARADSICLKTR